MSSTDTSNSTFQLAAQFVNQTGRTLFLTGKAGTGKTTFLKYIRDNCFKKMAVVAPTGVAAINAGGVTMHSFFQLPFGPFLPARQGGWHTQDPGYSDPDSLFRNIRFNTSRRELLKELELLIIDEVSMVRADMLDAVDAILRHFREQPLLPFGGVQVLYIGDLYQLPPVVSKEEWEILQQYYKSPFFFDAQVVHQSPPVCLELTKIYRQNETAFIDILNNIRNGQATAWDLEKLHDHYDPEFSPPRGTNYITLTSHNARADEMNQSKLNNIPGQLRSYEATVTGEFSDKAYPAEKILQLKEGAQIMLIRNDKGEARRYFNGKIGTIQALAAEKITIRFPEEADELILEKETWKNIRYNFNRENDKIEEEELGSFSQYPIRLAWAITIHKSQGLTFDQAIIDAGASFAAGQVYVALSRLTSLEGLVLRSRIHPWSIQTDPRVIGFSQSRLAGEGMDIELKDEQLIYISASLLRAFDWSRLTDQLQDLLQTLSRKPIPGRIQSMELGYDWMKHTVTQQETAAKFSRQLEQLLLTAAADNYQQLYQRMEAATRYFISAMQKDVLDPLEAFAREIGQKKGVKKHQQTLRLITSLFTRKKQQLEEAGQMVSGLMEGIDTTKILTGLHDLKQEQKQNQQKEEGTMAGEQDPSDPKKPKKGDTNKATLKMYRDGLTLVEIAARRSLALTTVESHLASFIITGEIDIKELVDEKKIGPITAAIEETGGTSLGPIRGRLGDQYSFGEIRAVMNYLRIPPKQAAQP